MAFEFWLIDEKSDIKLLLPVTPKMYDIDHGNDIQTINATAKGDINIAGYRKLMNIEIEGFFTIKDYYFANITSYVATDPIDYVNVIKKWVDDRTVIRLVIANNSVTKINEQFYIENINYSEDNTSNGDINYKITLREFRAMNTSDVKTTHVKENKTRTFNAAPKKTKEYIVTKGDNLTKIARKMYGDGSKWRTIYNANKSIIGKNPNLIFPGQKYVIP